MALSLKPEHLKRYKDVALLLFKYGRGDLVTSAGLTDLLPEEPHRRAGAAAAAEGLADDVEALGTTFIKLGQLLSTRPDIVPPAYAEALERLQDHCEPFPVEQAAKILEEDLGMKLEAFGTISAEPLAAGSVAQVHRAVLCDGRELVLKIQRPGIREQVAADLEALGEVAGFLERHSDFGERFGAAALFDEFRKSLLRELDFRHEAMHMLTIAGNLEQIPEIVIPRPAMRYSTSRVLAMEFVHGTKVTELSPLERLELDGDNLVDALFRAYLKQILRDGTFHADPHPGNVFVAGGRLALIDLGMVGRVPPGLQDRLLQLLLAVSDNKADEVASVLVAIGECGPDADRAAFTRAVTDVVAQHQELARRKPQVGRTLLMLLKTAGDHGVRLPPELALIGKTLLNLDRIGETLAPRFDPNAAIRRHAAEITERQVMRELSLNSIFTAAVGAKNFIQHLPERLNRILERLADNTLRVKVDTIDEAQLMAGLQKVANRITTGLILASLIVGAALLMDVQTSFQLFGYPGLAILLFLGAAAGGVFLVVSILANDIKARRN